MRSYKKGFLMVISILLCSILITSSVVSSTFAKYTTSGSGSPSARVSKWGITVTSDTDLANTYETGNTATVQSKGTLLSPGEDGIIAPGTRGVLASITIEGKPEVAYEIDFSGSLSIGEGFLSTSGLLRNSIGEAIEYFPIVLYLREYDVDSNGELTMVKGRSLSTIRPKIFPEDGDTTADYYILQEKISTDDSIYETLAKIVEKYNDKNDEKGIKNYFDTTGKPNDEINKCYRLEWEWLYTPNEGTTPLPNYLENGKNYQVGYQTKEFDTVLGEAIAKNPAAFAVTSEMNVTVSQID